MTHRSAIAQQAATSADWWDVSGATCLAAYQPKGAASLAASYVNLANPGTYSATPGVAPTLAAGGWVHTGTEYLSSGITPANDQTAVIAVIFSGVTGNRRVSVGAQTGAGRLCAVWAKNTAGVGEWDNGGAQVIGTNIAAGTMLLARDRGYLDGSLAVSDIAAWSGTSSWPLWIGAMNYAGGPNYAFAGTIAAVYIGSTSETDTTALDQFAAALTTAMEAL